MLSHYRISLFLSLFISIFCVSFAAEAPHVNALPSNPLHAPGEDPSGQKKLPTSLLSPKATPTPAGDHESVTSESQTVTYDPRLLLPAGKTIGFARTADGKIIETAKIIENENVLILEGVEVYLQDRRSQLLSVLALECVDAATATRLKEKEQDVRRAIATTVGRYSVQKVSSLEGKLELRDDITRAVNQALGTTGIKEVYFQLFTLIVARK